MPKMHSLFYTSEKPTAMLFYVRLIVMLPCFYHVASVIPYYITNNPCVFPVLTNYDKTCPYRIPCLKLALKN